MEAKKVEVMNEANVKHSDRKDEPRRETAVTVLTLRIAALDRERAGLAEMLELVGKLPVGSPGEETAWELLIAARANRNRMAFG